MTAFLTIFAKFYEVLLKLILLNLPQNINQRRFYSTFLWKIVILLNFWWFTAFCSDNPISPVSKSSHIHEHSKVWVILQCKTSIFSVKSAVLCEPKLSAVDRLGVNTITMSLRAGLDHKEGWRREGGDTSRGRCLLDSKQLSSVCSSSGIKKKSPPK